MGIGTTSGKCALNLTDIKLRRPSQKMSRVQKDKTLPFWVSF